MWVKREVLRLYEKGTLRKEGTPVSSSFIDFLRPSGLELVIQGKNLLLQFNESLCRPPTVPPKSVVTGKNRTSYLSRPRCVLSLYLPFSLFSRVRGYYWRTSVGGKDTSGRVRGLERGTKR